MESLVIKNALGSLDRLLGDTRRALVEIARDVYRHRYDDKGFWAEPEAVLVARLESIHDALLVVLEAAGMPEARAKLAKDWQQFLKTDDGLQTVKRDDENEICFSPAEDYLNRLINGLRMTITAEMTSEEAWRLTLLEGILEDTAVLLNRRKIVPSDEHDIRRVMHDYLEACFPDFVPNPKITGFIKEFKPDCGISRLNAAIEFKIVHQQNKAQIAFSGIAEDTAGYKGSKEWTRFYAVIYQAGPFIPKRRLEFDMKRLGAVTWKSVIITGPTQPKRGKRSPK